MQDGWEREVAELMHSSDPHADDQGSPCTSDTPQVPSSSHGESSACTALLHWSPTAAAEMEVALGGRFTEGAMRSKYQAYVGESSRLLLRIRMGAPDCGEAARRLDAARADFFQHIMLTAIHQSEVLCSVVLQPMDGSQPRVVPGDDYWIWAASQMRLTDTQLDLAADLLEMWAARTARIMPAQQQCISELATTAADAVAQEAIVRSMEGLMSATSANLLLTMLPFYFSILTAGQVASYLTATFPWLPTLPCLYRSITAIKREHDVHKAGAQAQQPAAAGKPKAPGARRQQPGAEEAQGGNEAAASGAAAAAAAQFGGCVSGTGSGPSAQG